MSYTQGKQWQSQALTSMKTLHNRKIQVQVTAVARPRNQHLRKAEKNTHTTIRPDGGFFVLWVRQAQLRVTS